MPTASDDVTICATRTVTVNVAAVALSVDIQSGGTLTQTASTLTISGPLNVAGTHTCGNTLAVAGATSISGALNITATTGTKTFTGAVTINSGGVWNSTVNEPVTFNGGLTHNGATFTTGTGTYTFATNSQAIGGASPISFGGAVTVSGAITVTNNNTNTVTIAGILNGSVAGSTWVNAANSTLNYSSSGSANAPMATGVLTANANPNTVIYSRGGNQTIKSPSAGYYHLTLSTSGTKTAPGGTLDILGDLTINAGPTLTANANDPTINVTGNVTIDGTYLSSNNAARPLTIDGNLTVSGTYTGNGAPANLAGDFTNSGTFASGTGTFTFNGSALQTLTGATTITNMTVNNTGAGLQLASDITVSASTTVGALTLTAGIVSTGANTLIVSPRPCTASVIRTAGWVAGNLRLQFPTGAPSCTFPVGDGSAYRPIDMSFASVTTAGALTGTVSQSAGEHPDIATSGLDAAKDVNRYWTLTDPGGIAFTTYAATFNFINPGDIDAGATPASFEIERWDGSAWNNTTLSAAGATSTAASGLPPLAGSSNSFAVGEKKGPYVVSINLASPDPTSPATLVDWTVTFSASVTGVDASDFALVPGGGVSGAAITGVTGSGTTWTVTASTGAGAGTLGLNLVDDDTIINAALKPLGGTGAGNGNFTGQVYTVVYTASGYVFTDSVCTHNVAIGPPGCALVIWSPQVAGQDLTGIYITAVNTSGVPTRLHASQDRTRSMEFGLSCHNPVADAGRQATFAGATLPLCQANGATPATWSSTVTVTFPGGSPSSNVSYTFNYADVGSVELWMRNNAIPAETGNSGAFVVKPGGFLLSAIQQTALPNLANPGAADASGAKFVKAGEAFSVTVTATTSGGAATPNYGKETTPEGVKLTATLVAPSGGASPALQNPAAFGAFTGGVATGTTFAWGEVGIITLTPSVGDGDYLGAGDVTGTVSGNVGRFYPYQYNISDPSLTPGTGTISYLDQPFGAALTLTAKDAAGGTTTNYTTASGFAKLDPTNPVLWPSTTLGSTGFALGARNGTTDLSVRLSLDGTPSGTWSGGAATVSAQIKLARPTTTTPDATWGAYDNLDIGVAPQDSDGVTLAAAALDMDANNDSTNERKTLGQTKARFGRLRLINFYGSELLKPRVEYRAEYWDGSRWTTNTLDSSTAIVAGNVANGGLTVSAVSMTTNAGSGFITFNTAAVGKYDIAVNLGATPNDASCNTSHPATTAANLPWLKGFWSAPANCGGVAAWDQDPNARIRLGSPKAPYIYLRERY